MPFPVTPDMTAEQFRDEIIDCYFPQFKDSTLREDYATIGAFLTNRVAVLSSLKGLENELRNYLVCHAPPEARQSFQQSKVAKGETASGATYAIHKVLSAVLGRYEFEEGFNNPKVQGSLHSKSLYAEGSNSFDMQPKARSPKDKMSLPKGVPTIAGSNLHGMDFNRILLRHGYQFKDVGASKEHGEYIHRLQWYAICHAKALGDLQLKNAPIDIYKSMGAVGELTASATQNVSEPLHLYIWEALFDCFPSEAAGRSNGTKAHCNKTYNCPEYLNMRLSRPMNWNALAYDESDSSNLFCLTVFMRLRYEKRASTEDVDYVEKKLFSNSKTRKAVASASSSVGIKNAGSRLQNAVYWYVQQ